MTDTTKPDACREAWCTMDSAPLDGTEVLLQVEKRAGVSGRCLVGHYMPGGHCIEDHPPITQGWYFWSGSAFDLASRPVAWMPIPGVAPPAPQPSEDKRDTERLDWLDKMNSVLNQHYGTVYLWRLILSPNIVRLMVGVQQRGFVGDLDLNDAQSGENSFTSCREAIDAARASTGDKA